jgi:hypothetical protein
MTALDTCSQKSSGHKAQIWYEYSSSLGQKETSSSEGVGLGWKYLFPVLI